MKNKILFCILVIICFTVIKSDDKLPIVLNTWYFIEAGEKAWETLYIKDGTVIDSVEVGCTVCEQMQCDGTVGYGGSPDENGETTLDAMMMNGTDLNVGAVAGLRRIKNVISVARKVLETTKHTLIVGDQATEFAKQLGYTEESLQTEKSYEMWIKWKENICQPNFRINVEPDPTKNCGPYRATCQSCDKNTVNNFNSFNHDTIGMIAIDRKGRIVAGTSTNGARNKIPGRVGDSPIPGAGAYADDDVGAAAATGDGDIMMRLLPSFQAVEQMRQGRTPTQAAHYAIKRVITKYPIFFGAVIAVDKTGNYGAACHGMDKFPFTVCNTKINKCQIEYSSCISLK